MKLINYRGVQLIRTMKIVEKPSELAKSSELAASCGWSIFDLKRDFLSTISTYFFYKRSNIVLKYSKTQFLHSEIRFMRLKIAKKEEKMTKNNFKLFPKKSSELAPSELAKHPCTIKVKTWGWSFKPFSLV